MFELMASSTAVLLCFKDLKVVLNSSVVESKSLMASLKNTRNIKISSNFLRLAEYFLQGKDLHW